VSEHPVRLSVSDDLVRERVTVFFRGLLAIPHFIWLALWGVVALLAAIVNWVATLALGRSPLALHNFLAAYVKYATQFYAYIHLAADPYPPFDGQAGYPVDVTIAAPVPQRRWTVALRGLLFLPAALIAAPLVGAPTGISSLARNTSYSGNLGLLHLIGLFGWFAIMARGSMPRGLRDLGTYALSYGAQFWAYAFLLTERYPDSDPRAALGELPARSDPVHLEVGEDLRRSRLTVFFRLLLAIPHIVWLQLWGILVLLASIVNWFATLFTGRSPAWAHRFLSAYVRYQLHVYAFLYLIANPFPGFVGRPGSYPVEAVIAERERQNRWKTGFRILLILPALLLAGAYGSLVTVAAILGWFSSLVRARMPLGLRNAGALALRYHAQVLGYALLLTDSYPYSGPVGDAAEVAAQPPATAPVPVSDEPVPDAPSADAPAARTLPELGLS